MVESLAKQRVPGILALMTAPSPAYIRKAELVEVHDGDTITLRLDHGKFPKTRSCDEVAIRVKGLYCPELSQSGGLEARDFTASLLADATSIIAQTYKGSFERTIADVWIDGELLADKVIAAGHGAAVAM